MNFSEVESPLSFGPSRLGGGPSEGVTKAQRHQDSLRRTCQSECSEFFGVTLVTINH